MNAQILEKDGKPEFAVIPIEEYKKLLARKDHSLLIWREFRGLTQDELAGKARLGPGTG